MSTGQADASTGQADAADTDPVASADDERTRRPRAEGGVTAGLSRRTRTGGTPRGAALTPRDLELLRWLGRHGLVTPEQVARRFFTSPWAAYRRLRKIEGVGLIQRDPTYWKAPHVLRLTPAGSRLAAVGVQPAALILAEVPHALALVDLSERLLAAHPGAGLTTERQIRAERLRARRAGRQPVHQGRIPDAVLLLPTGARIAIELDLTPKRGHDCERIADAYSQDYSRDHRADAINAVWWYVRPGVLARMRMVLRAWSDFIELRTWTHDH